MQKGISTLIGTIILLAVIIVVGGGILAYQYWWLPKLEIANKSIPTVNNFEYKTVALKDVIGYAADMNQNNYIKTTGTVVNVKYDNYGGTIVLSDGNNNYILAVISHAGMSEKDSPYPAILSNLKSGDNIDVNGIATFTSREVLFNATKIDNTYKNLLSINQNLPDEIGMVSITGLIQIVKK